jgi:hypothetical protein
VRTKSLLLFILVLLAAGCAKPPGAREYSWDLYTSPTMTSETFKDYKIAILPAARIQYDTTQEVYRETIGGVIYQSFIKHSNGRNFLPVAVTQSGINRAEIWSDVLEMYKEFETTDILRKDVLQKIGRALDVHYVLMPKMLRFQQEVFDRATIFGISFLKTRQSTVDVQVQLWDTDTGEVVWQAVGEGATSVEVVEGRPVSFITVAGIACESLAYRIPWLPEVIKKKNNNSTGPDHPVTMPKKEP